MTVALLAKQLDHLTRYSWEVESEIGAEVMSSSLVHRPPAEYLPLVPESPMGYLLGFQYRDDENAPTDQLGRLSFFRCTGIGRWLLLHLPHLFGDSTDGQPRPGVLLLSATSWAGTSPRYDVQVPVAGILSSHAAEAVPVDERIECFYLPSSSKGPDGRSYGRKVSGKLGDKRTAALSDILVDFCTAQPGPRGVRPSTLERIRDDLEPGRHRLLLLVGSGPARSCTWFRTTTAAPITGTTAPSPAAGYPPSPATRTYGNLITPMLAIERGHNILNDDHVAALGAALYLVRPHLRPEDLGYHIESMNRWGVEQIRTGMPAAGMPDAPMGERAEVFQRIAHRRWADRLEEPLRYALTAPLERHAMDWTNIPPLNQIAGRMLRGAARARIYFCDGAFAPRSDDSILLGMYRPWRRRWAMSGPHSEIATPLYLPLKHGLHKLLEQYRGDV
ncbi:hypothetical protein [Streptomyces sp. NPDC091259]|uniref:hypothetical protein n=1 Tax=Streptomyces sp. NPDC091259 TaxID=3365976 RepID=UPI0037FBF5B9